MTNKEYRQDPGISRSDLFEMRKSPLHFQYQMTHPKEDTPALLFGRALHKMILEPGDFESEFAVCPTVNRRTKAGQEQYAAFMAEGTRCTMWTSLEILVSRIYLQWMHL